MYTSQVIYLDRKCYAKGIIEALCTCLLQTAASVDSNIDNVWQLGEDEQQLRRLPDALQPPRGPQCHLPGWIYYLKLGTFCWFSTDRLILNI